jgi:muconolactone delta-isomerase
MVYLVERELPGITMEQLAAAQKRAIQVGRELTAQGRQVRYIRSMFVPGEARCMCLFEATDAQDVREANERAEIPFTRIVPAEDLTPASS